MSRMVELVETTTQDSLTLHGAVFAPPPDSIRSLNLDAMLLLHGVGNNFYSSSTIVELAGFFAQHGVTVLSANTRGHDFVSLTRTKAGPQRQGASYETVGHCHYDIAAWSDFLCQRGATSIVLAGHSLGAVKALYATALSPHRATCAVVAISPPRLSYAAFRAGPRADLFAKMIARAEAQVVDGKPEALIRVNYPFPLLITAAGYLEKYGPEERYDFLKFVPQLACPSLFTYGQQELESGSAAFTGVPDAIAQLPNSNQLRETVTIPNADHLYTGRTSELASRILPWLQQLSPAPL